MFDSLIANASQTYRVPESWIRAVIQTESSWKPDAYRPEPRINDASYGLMQLLERTARGLGFTGSPEDLFLPEINIPLGTQLLGQLRDKHGDDFRRVYSAYNSGRPDLWETSTQVATHVSRAVANLQKYVEAEIQHLTATVAESGPAQLAVAALLIMTLMWAWGGKRK